LSPAEVRALVAEVLGIEEGQVSDALAFGERPEWDSLGHVNLMLALEERLEVEIGAEQMVELASVAAIEAFVSAQPLES
jgi:citrate synthase